MKILAKQWLALGLNFCPETGLIIYEVEYQGENEIVHVIQIKTSLFFLFFIFL